MIRIVTKILEIYTLTEFLNCRPIFGTLGTNGLINGTGNFSPVSKFDILFTSSLYEFSAVLLLGVKLPENDQ